jgi:hypothetical protein
LTLQSANVRINVGEFGDTIKKTTPPPARQAKDDADLWKDDNDFAYYVMEDAILYDREGKLQGFELYVPQVLVDVGEPGYRRFMLEQAKRHIEKFPVSSGLCNDEMNYLRMYNPRRDDGMTWNDGLPARALVNSWKDFMDRLRPLMSDGGKVIHGKPLYHSLDLMRHLGHGRVLIGTLRMKLRRGMSLRTFVCKGIKCTHSVVSHFAEKRMHEDGTSL